MFESFHASARRLKLDVMTVYFAARDARTPWQVRALALAVAAYALSPIDLIPDFIPILGYVDDLILVPLGIYLILRWTPSLVVEQCREKAGACLARPRSLLAAVCIVGVWLLGAIWLAGYLAAG